MVVSTDTLRTDHLVNAFAGIVNRYNLNAKLIEEVIEFMIDDFGEPTEDDLEEENFLLERLFETLEEAAPEGYYFGSQEGDGACFGYWSIEEEE